MKHSQFQKFVNEWDSKSEKLKDQESARDDAEIKLPRLRLATNYALYYDLNWKQALPLPLLPLHGDPLRDVFLAAQVQKQAFRASMACACIYNWMWCSWIVLCDRRGGRLLHKYPTNESHQFGRRWRARARLHPLTDRGLHLVYCPPDP